MSLIFNGLATIYSTCRRCGGPMQVLDADETVHPTCEPKPTKLESLVTGYASTLAADDTEAAELTAAEIAKIEAAPPQLGRSALWYARWGWPVFPLRPVGTPCDGGKKCEQLCQCPKSPLPKSHGFKDATTQSALVERLWTARPTLNVGLATGHRFDVIDIDPRHGGNESFQKLLHAKRLPDIHGIVVTGSGGMHLYIKPTGAGNGAGLEDERNQHKFTGIDFRGKGGYVVAPPSTLGPRQRSWSWMTVPSPVIKARP